MLKEEKDNGKLFFQEQVKIVENMKIETYEQNPIEDFGKNMLYKMGWKDNTPIGRTNKGLVKPVEFIPRQKGLGLGAIPLKEMPKGNEGNVEKQNYCGTNVKIIQGLHKNLKGILIDCIDDIKTYLSENEYINIQLKINDQVVKVRSSNIKLYNSDKKSKKSRSRSRSNQKKTKLTSDQGKYMRKELKWVIPNIKVRIISRKRLEGKYYNTKAMVNDICDRYSFSVVTCDGLVFNDFEEKDLETIIPSLNEDVIILNGDYKGEEAKLLSRDKKKDKVLVQAYTDMSIVSLRQDDITEIFK